MPVIATNTAANTALIALNKNSRGMGTILSKLSSGSRIVRASDDAAGLAVSNSLQSDITTLKQAAINAVQAQSVLQTTDGALARIGDILMRIKSLTASAISGSVSNTERGFIESEHNSIWSEMINIGLFTDFNGTPLLQSYNQDFQVGTNAATDVIHLNLLSVNWTSAMAVNAGLPISTPALATITSAAIDTALNQLSSDRALVGAYLSRFQSRGDLIDTSLENLQSAKSAIVDTDLAAEQTALTSSQVLTETSVASLVQANKMKSDLLSLMK